MENTIKKIIAYFEENEDTFNECIEELDSYNGYLGDDRYYEMDMLNELFTDCDNIDLLNRAFFGRDDDNWHTDAHGERFTAHSIQTETIFILTAMAIWYQATTKIIQAILTNILLSHF